MNTLPLAAIVSGFAVLGVVAAGPASAVLARAGWTARGPTAALVLWQALCLCAGLSLTGATVLLAIAPLGRHLPAALVALGGNVFDGAPFRSLAPWRIVLLLVGATFAVGLLAVLARCFVLALRRRSAHRELLDLLSRPARPGPRTATSADGTAADSTAGPHGGVRPAEPIVPDGVRVLDHATPVAYGVPGWHARLVLTAGLVDLLSPRQLAAVIEHERAHLRAHHDLLLLPFQAWAAALGRFPGVHAARRSVAALAEMQADDAAAREVGGATVASALATVVLAGTGDQPGTTTVPPAAAAGPAAAGPAVVRRVTRMRDPHPLPRFAVSMVYLAAMAMLLAPTVVLFIGWR